MDFHFTKLLLVLIPASYLIWRQSSKDGKPIGPKIDKFFDKAKKTVTDFDVDKFANKAGDGVSSAIKEADKLSKQMAGGVKSVVNDIESIIRTSPSPSKSSGASSGSAPASSTSEKTSPPSSGSSSSSGEKSSGSQSGPPKGTLNTVPPSKKGSSKKK